MQGMGQEMGQDTGQDIGMVRTSVRRVEDQRFVTGTGTFIDDVNLPGQAYAAILRSAHAHARIGAIDTSRARRARGAAGGDRRGVGRCRPRAHPDQVDGAHET
jgi:xanthine dehydrogenase molybdopterin-binding subunit B